MVSARIMACVERFNSYNGPVVVSTSPSHPPALFVFDGFVNPVSSRITEWERRMAAHLQRGSVKGGWSVGRLVDPRREEAVDNLQTGWQERERWWIGGLEGW